ncbi:hypothetical protein DWQ65_07470 [Treponema phagedenis]|uniref:Uncharacterized protein n=1 Tax=Treponema phagedenis TaxID=162 RepID=A0A0B7GUY9_TREPH|nr:hypothetical protein [Treponema phagedenis]QSH99906.1 hypothetical protein DWQ65_07470 [Treponema phagedenis]CEM60481.1 conserved hypothetical protein [Treponema phagedenis]
MSEPITKVSEIISFDDDCTFGNVETKLSNGWTVTQKFSWSFDSYYEPEIDYQCEDVGDLSIFDKNMEPYSNELTSEEEKALARLCIKDADELTDAVYQQTDWKSLAEEVREYNKNPYSYYGVTPLDFI